MLCRRFGCEVEVPVANSDGAVEMTESSLLACLLFRCLASYGAWHVLTFKRQAPPKNLRGPISMMDMFSMVSLPSGKEGTDERCVVACSTPQGLGVLGPTAAERCRCERLSGSEVSVLGALKLEDRMSQVESTLILHHISPSALRAVRAPRGGGGGGRGGSGRDSHRRSNA